MPSPTDLSPLAPRARVLVAGARVTGRAVLRALAPWDLRLSVCDDNAESLVELSGVEAMTPADAAARAAGFDLVVTSPGFPPTTPVLAAAAAAGVPIWGDVELAWRLDAAGHYGPPRQWLVVTGTNGKTTTTSMLHAMLLAGFPQIDAARLAAKLAEGMTAARLAGAVAAGEDADG